MPRKIGIVVGGVILAILALSFFATGYNLGGKPLVIHEERYETGNVERFFDDDNYGLRYDITNETVLLVNISSLHRKPVPTFELIPENVSPGYIALPVLRPLNTKKDAKYIGEREYEEKYIVLPKEVADSFGLSPQKSCLYLTESVPYRPGEPYIKGAASSLDGRFKLIWDYKNLTYILEYSTEPLIPLSTYDSWLDAVRNKSPNSSVVEYVVGVCCWSAWQVCNRAERIYENISHIWN